MPAATPMPAGWRFEPGFLSAAEEAELLAAIAQLPLHEAEYKGYTARRRVANFGTAYDFAAHRLLPGPPIPEVLLGLRERVATWAGLAPDALSSALVAEYRAGTPLGWHRDVPDFEVVVGVSLGTPARMRLRRYPPVNPRKADVLNVELPPRSIYRLEGEARWGWQHSIAPTPALRHSVTFRTRSTRRSRGLGPAGAG
ncbi:alpha-ketoglutarate-dependent dioxygenase AlkB [Piscinibacter koreensis]|nr:alpha-ketoglutarate-dependent dioxygenase AlkB [Schlegelella koreensis]